MKMRLKFEKVLSIILTFSILLSMIPAFALKAFAASPITDISGLEISDNKGNGKYSNGKVTITATGSSYTEKATNIITLKNVSGKAATLTFDYSVVDYDSHTFPSDSGTFSQVLGVDEYVEFSIKSKRFKHTVTLTLQNISLVPVPEFSNVTFEYNNTLGVVNVNNNVISNGEALKIPSGGVNIVATPNNGVSFLGWINSKDGTLVSKTNNFNLISSADMTIKAAFSTPSSKAWFLVDDKYYYDDLNVAVTKGNKVVLAADGTLPAGNYTIPAGVTLLIPRDEAGTVNEATPNRSDDTYEKPSPFRTLNMASGANIVVNGKLCVNGTQCAVQTYAGHVVGKYGCINMNSNAIITMKNGSNLYAWGYITGAGNVIAESGSSVYEDFQLTDFRGGDVTSQMAKGTNNVFPMSQYYVQNIEVPLKIFSGASIYADMSVKISFVGIQGAGVPIVGPSGAMFRVDSGYVIKDYIEGEGRLEFEIHGNVSVSPISLSMKLAILGSTTINSENFNLPIPGHMTVRAVTGNVAISQDIALFPGAELYIGKDVNCTLASGKKIIVYDLDQWGNYCWHKPCRWRALPFAPGGLGEVGREKDALVQIDGYVDASEGYVYTTVGLVSEDGTVNINPNSTANVYTTGTGILIVKAGADTRTYQVYNQADSNIKYQEIVIAPAILKNGNTAHPTTGTKNATNETKYYYNTVCDMWVIGDINSTEVPESKHNHVSTVTEPTCTEQGYTTHTCSICGDSYKDTYVAALGHKDENNNCKCDTCEEQLDHDYNEGVVTTEPTCTEKGVKTFTCSVCGGTNTEAIEALGHSYGAGVITPPTCTEQGYTTYTCTVCGHTYKDAYVDALGHKYEASVTTEPTCTENGVKTFTCSVCGDSYTEAIEALGHSYGDGVVTTEPTCTEKGVKTFTCGTCGDSYTEEIDALGHKYESSITKDPTCTEKGIKTYTCSVCGDSYTEEVAELGHSYNAVVTDPTCTGKGFTTHTCSTCGDSYVDTYVDALGHSYDDGVVTTEPTCTEKGVKTFTCGTCGDSYTEEIDAVGHSYDAVVTAPTCTEQGYTTYTCSACGDSYVDDYVDALGHSYNAVVTDPTCTEQGYTTYTCSACGDSYVDDYVDALGHSYDAVVTDPTCTEQGYTTYTCSCGDSYVDDYVDALGHKDENNNCKCDTCDEQLDHDYDAVVTAPTCTDKGYTTHTCSICKDSYVDSYVDALGHSYNAVVTKPTCTDKGYTTYTCSCGDSYVDDYVDALGHKDENNNCKCDTCDEQLDHDYNAVVTDPTCTEQGYTTYTCSVCGHSENKDFVDATGHSYDAVVTDPTCTEQGFTTHTCSVCGNSYVDIYVDALGHSYDDGVVTTEPTCTEKGVKTFTCGTCGDSYTEEIDAVGHSYDAVVTAPTCTEQGFTTHTCSCGDSYVDNYVEALGHSYDAVVTDPTCTEQGYTTYTCTVCGHSENKDFVDATGHDYVSVVTDPTCTDKGYTTHTCSACGDSYVDTYVDELGHDYESSITKDPTCTEKGVKTFTCSACGDSYTEEIDALGHSYNAVVTDPTCTEQGYTTYTCSCGDSYVDDYVDALGHKDENHDHVCENNCGISQGTHADSFEDNDHVCDYGCNAVLEECIDNDHDHACDNGCDTYFGEHKDDNFDHNCDYGCSEKIGICADSDADNDHVCDYGCGDVLEACIDEDDDTDHNCDICGKENVTEHDYDAVVTDPTCTERGFTTHTCSTCGDSYIDDYIDENGHTHGWFEHDLYKHWSVCSVAGCGASYDEDEHVFVNDSCECGARRVSVDKVGNSDIEYVVIGQTVTVTHEDACTVAYISNGEYVKLEAIANDDGSYSFVAPDGVNEVKLFVIGDYDGDGALTDDDATSLKNTLLGKETLNDTPVFVYDVNGDQKITAIDLALISAAAQRSINLGY